MKKYLIPVIIIIISLLGLAGCAKNETAVGGKVERGSDNLPDNTYSPAVVEFSGERGQSVMFENGKIELNEADINGHLVKYYNTVLPEGKTVYFFVVKDNNGVYRAAGNACQVCAEAKMGFRQEGNFLVCNTCGNKYPLEKIATEKGGCNPVPINPNLETISGKIIINQSDVLKVADYF